MLCGSVHVVAIYVFAQPHLTAVLSNPSAVSASQTTLNGHVVRHSSATASCLTAPPYRQISSLAQLQPVSALRPACLRDSINPRTRHNGITATQPLALIGRGIAATSRSSPHRARAPLREMNGSVDTS
jgi:hypothetical protein